MYFIYYFKKLKKELIIQLINYLFLKNNKLNKL